MQNQILLLKPELIFWLRKENQCNCSLFPSVFRDDERQRICLDIVYKMLSKLKPLELKGLLPGVTGFISHPSAVCRQRMYDILMWIYDNYRCVFTADAAFQGLGTDRANVLVALYSNFMSLSAVFFPFSEEESLWFAYVALAFGGIFITFTTGK